MGLAEEAHLGSSLSSEAGWVELGPAEIELVGEAQARTAPASRPAASQRVTQAPWAMILAIATFVVDICAVFLGYYISKNLLSAWTDTSHATRITAIYATVAIWPVVFAVYGLYDLRRPTHATAEFRRLFNGAVMSVLLVALIAIEVDPRVNASKGLILGRGFIPTLLVVCLVTVVAGRLVTRRLSHTLNARAVTSQLTLIAGTNDEARALARTLMRRPWMGYRVCGFVEVTSRASR